MFQHFYAHQGADVLASSTSGSSLLLFALRLGRLACRFLLYKVDNHLPINSLDCDHIVASVDRETLSAKHDRSTQKEGSHRESVDQPERPGDR